MERDQKVEEYLQISRSMVSLVRCGSPMSTITTAMLFGKTLLHMAASGLILIGTLTPLSAIGGSLIWPRVQERWGVGNKEIHLTLLVLASFILVYGYLGFLFEGSGVKFTPQGEMYALGVYFGFVYGAFRGDARSFYAELLPPGEEARWYGLFSITDRSPSFIGPLFVEPISDLIGNIRYSFFLVGLGCCADVDLG